MKLTEMRALLERRTLAWAGLDHRSNDPVAASLEWHAAGEAVRLALVEHKGSFPLGDGTEVTLTGDGLHWLICYAGTSRPSRAVHGDCAASCAVSRAGKQRST